MLSFLHPNPYFSSWGGITNKAVAGDMYTRIFNRLLKSDLGSDKDRGRNMSDMWTNPEYKDQFNVFWEPVVNKPVIPKRKATAALALDVKQDVFQTAQKVHNTLAQVTDEVAGQLVAINAAASATTERLTTVVAEGSANGHRQVEFDQDQADDWAFVEDVQNDESDGMRTPPSHRTVEGDIPFAEELKLIRVGGINSAWDENSYTSIWINLDLTSLYAGVDGLISAAYANENHFTPSAWRRTLARDKASQKGTNVDGFYVGTGGLVGLIVENVGSPTCSSFTKKGEDEEKCWRNSADALLERVYFSTGSFDIAKGYRVMSMVIYAREVTLYQTGIISQNVYRVQKLFQGYYHSSKSLLTNLMVHLKICLIIKRAMERNQEVNDVFNKSIDSDLLKNDQAHHNLRLHTTPKK
ncbi:hypothetical protein BGZ47_002261 [Haplosporangium gracile]|nr:hypothetical protein BGZ47_002261 [Haplosporangium gracile]